MSTARFELGALLDLESVHSPLFGTTRTECDTLQNKIDQHLKDQKQLQFVSPSHAL